MKRFGRKKEFTTTRIIAVGFFVTIVIGTFLLMPVSYTHLTLPTNSLV